MKGIRPARGTCSTYPEGMRQQMQPVIQPEALADISRPAVYAFAVYTNITYFVHVGRHSNEIRAPIANPPTVAQLKGTPTIPDPPSYIRIRAVLWECGERQTGTQPVIANTHFASTMPQAKCNNFRAGGRLTS